MKTMKHKIREVACTAAGAAVLWLGSGYADTGENAMIDGEILSAEDYFHGGARPYVRGEAEQARSVLEEGLTHHPDDEKIRRLIELLEEQHEPPTPPEQNEDDPDETEPENGEDAEPGEGEPDPDPGEQETDPDTEPTTDAEPEGAEEVADRDPGQMTEEEAEMILEDMLQHEERTRSDMELRFGPETPVDKDW